MAPSWFLVVNICYLSEKGYQKHTITDNVVWLSCYACISAIFSYLRTVNQSLTIFLFRKIYVIGNTPIG